ncbi:pirin family protein [Olivibacter sp. XZL3]|uniref:pirin family protein n=1 Tax=Olivibacter sp. XZL3 TaxID=1735116 RepID=UPI0010652922|nr:pirin family protein [Olivibacter sp. XZL3]
MNTERQKSPTYILYKNDSRGTANHGWLKSFHTFSFGSYYNPERIRFGALRVFNDDFVEGGMGFGEHPHDNMEIISVPLEGLLEHKDSLGNTTLIKPGEIQVMSAGTGVYHTEYNKNRREPVKFLQIWIFPKTRNVHPRYDQLDFSSKLQQNKLLQILSHNKDDEGVWIHQDAWMNIGAFDRDHLIEYTLKKEQNGLFIFVIEGAIQIENYTLSTRDAIGVFGLSQVKATAIDNCKVLLIEVPPFLN